MNSSSAAAVNILNGHKRKRSLPGDFYSSIEDKRTCMFEQLQQQQHGFDEETAAHFHALMQHQQLKAGVVSHSLPNPPHFQDYQHTSTSNSSSNITSSSSSFSSSSSSSVPGTPESVVLPFTPTSTPPPIINHEQQQTPYVARRKKSVSFVPTIEAICF